MPTDTAIQIRHLRVPVRIYSLAEYEAMGGDYSDAGNGGECWACDREPCDPSAHTADEVARARARFCEAVELIPEDLLEAPAEDTWYDSTLGLVLLRAPAEQLLPIWPGAPRRRHPVLQFDDPGAAPVHCPDCGQLEVWSESECMDHGRCRALPAREPCPVCGEELR